MPLATLYVVPAATHMMQAPPYANIKVAVVIESAVILLDVEDTLRDLDTGAIHATSSPAQALAFLGGDHIDVAILGIGEYSAGGQTLFVELQQQNVPIILIESGTALFRGHHAPAGQATLSVPFDTAAVAYAIDRALGRR